VTRISQARTALATSVLLLTALCSSTLASAKPGPATDFRLALSTRSPNAPTGLTAHISFSVAGDPSAKPPPLRSALIKAPAGLRFDSTAVNQCTASDQELQAMGPDACPADTKLTVGSFSAITGFGPPADPFMGDDHVFNGPDQLIEVITFKGSSASPGFDRLTISGSTLTAHPPKAPGAPPDNEASVKSLEFQIPVRTAGTTSLVTTPPDCPADGEWTSTGTFGFADGSTVSTSSRTPCAITSAPATAPPPTPQSAALALTARPRRVTAHHRAVLRFRVRSDDARCLSGATIRLGNRRIVTDDQGRATLTTRLSTPGLRHIRARSPGCRSATAIVRVVAARRR
jgi:hypothetical protein